MRILHDSLSARFRKPTGALTPGQLCSMTLLVPANCMVETVFLCVDGENGFSMTVPMEQIGSEGEYQIWKTDISLFRAGWYEYCFDLHKKQDRFWLYREGLHDTNIACGAKWQITCCLPRENVNSDGGGVLYQIFPDRFAKSGDPDLREKLGPFTLHEPGELPQRGPSADGVWNTDFYGGNFRGIMEKLPYLAELSVETIYLNPICKARSNHRYDTADYRSPDPMLGSESDFSALCERAHSLGIRILLDGVFSHTGDDSIYFDRYGRWGQGAFGHPDSPYRDWYQFRGGNNPDDCVCWWGVRSLPCVNELNRSFLDYIIEGPDSVIAYWLKLGADGFRLDVADELPDEFLFRLYRRVKEIKPDARIIGEVWEDASNKISYGMRKHYFSRRELDGITNYPFRSAILSFVTGAYGGREFSDAIMTIAENYPAWALDSSMTVLSTHDTPRILTVLGNGNTEGYTPLENEARECALQRLRQAVFLQYMLPGMPVIYYGDEVGLEGGKDPYNRLFYPWNHENQALRDFYIQLGNLRKNSPVLRRGNISEGGSDRTHVHMIRRFNQTALHFFAATAPCELPCPQGAKWLCGAQCDVYEKTFKMNICGFAAFCCEHESNSMESSWKRNDIE